jgi:hypothetical protein
VDDTCARQRQNGCSGQRRHSSLSCRLRATSAQAYCTLESEHALATAAATLPAVESATVLSVWCAAVFVMYLATAGLRPGALQSAPGLIAAPGTVMLPRSRQAAPVYAGQRWCVARHPVGVGVPNGCDATPPASVCPVNTITCHPAVASLLVECIPRPMQVHSLSSGASPSDTASAYPMIDVVASCAPAGLTLPGGGTSLQ